MHYLKQTSFCAFWVEPKVYRHFPPCEVGASHVSFEPMVSMTHVHHRWEFAPLVLVFELWDNNFHSTSIQTCGKRSLKHPFVSFDPPNSSCSSDTVVFATAFIAYACAYVCCVHCDLWQVAKAIRPSDLDLPCFKFFPNLKPTQKRLKKTGWQWELHSPLFSPPSYALRARGAWLTPPSTQACPPPTVGLRL